MCGELRKPRVSEILRKMCIVDMSQSCQGPYPQTNVKMAKASPHQDKTWSQMAKPPFPSGLCVDVDNMCKMFTIAF